MVRSILHLAQYKPKDKLNNTRKLVNLILEIKDKLAAIKIQAEWGAKLCQVEEQMCTPITLSRPPEAT